MQKIRQSRTLSFLTVALIYLFAGVAGFLVYRILPYRFVIRLLCADLAATLLIFLFSLIFRNASVYDPYWSVAPVVILFGYLLSSPLTAQRIGVLCVVFLWGARLTGNWAYTFHGLAFQDWRYTMLREKTGAFYPIINLFGIHLVPTLIVFACLIPAVCIFELAPVQSGSQFFLLLSLLAVLLQGTSDYQLHRFRREKAGGLIRTGFWKYSRHPNYLGEILFWWGIALFGLSVFPGNYLLLIGAFSNTLLFLFVSIPMADQRQSRKEGFEQYKRETRMLLPVPRLARHESEKYN